MRIATLVAAAAFLLDWATKSWALRFLDGAAMPFGSLILGVERNTAFAFSAGEAHVPVWAVALVRLLALFVIIVTSRRFVARSRRYATGFALLLAGGFGNAVDLLFRGGAVVDFIGAGPFMFDWAGELMHVHFVFNVADIAIFAGVGLVLPVFRSFAASIRQRVGSWESRLLGRPTV